MKHKVYQYHFIESENELPNSQMEKGLLVEEVQILFQFIGFFPFKVVLFFSVVGKYLYT